MKIAINALSAKRGGGVTYLNRLIFHLRDADRKNEYFVFVTQKNREKIIAFVDPRFHVVEVPVQNLLHRLVYEQFVLPIMLKRLGIDVIYAPAEIAPLLAPCSVLLGIQNPNVYYGASIRWPLYHRIRNRVLRLLAIVSAKRASKIVFVSETARQDISKVLRVPLSKTNTVHHGVDTTVFFPGENESESIQAVGYRSGGVLRYILCVSHIDGHKNHKVLVEAFGALPGNLREKFKLVLVGKKTSPYYDELICFVKERMIEKDVVFFGEVPHEKLPEIFRGASLFVLPSYLETFGIPLVEAMASGVPIIASNTTAIPEIVGEAGILFDPDSSEMLRKLIEKVLSNDGLKQSLASKGLERSRQFTWSNAAARMLEIFERVYQEKGKAVGDRVNL